MTGISEAISWGPLLQWPQDAAQVCARITATAPVLRLAVKAKNETRMLTAWVQHHAAIVGAENLIIADNGSNEPEALALLSELALHSTVFQFSGLHNDIHDRGLYPELYAAFCTGAEAYMFMDADERLIWVEGDQWLADARILDRVQAVAPFSILPGIMLDNFAGSEEWFSFSPDVGFVQAIMRWGKPIISTSADISAGHRLHQSQFDTEVVSGVSNVNVLTAHLTHLDPQQRLNGNKNKLVARGAVLPDMSFQEIAAMYGEFTEADHSDVIARCILEIKRILDLLSGVGGASWGPSDPQNSIKLESDGCIKFGSSYVETAFSSLNISGGQYLRDYVNNRPGRLAMEACLAAIAVDKIQAEAQLRIGMKDYADLLDIHGDPTFRKELMRLLLSQGRFEKAIELIPEDPPSESSGWYHILFARALDAQGSADQARAHWEAFLEARPGHPEALAALGMTSVTSLDPNAPLQPHMTEAEQAMFAAQFQGVRNFLEFGAGGSTDLAARSGVQSIVSVESDAQWLNMLAQRPEIRTLDFHPRHIDIGPTGAWGVPTNPGTAPQWAAYHQAVWRDLPWVPDLVLVDGRFRVACTLAALLHCPAETRIVIHDFWDRPHYHAVLPYLDVLDRVDTLGVFRARADLSLRDLVGDLIAYALDMR